MVKRVDSAPALSFPLSAFRDPFPVSRFPFPDCPIAIRFTLPAVSEMQELEGHVQLARDLEVMTEQDFTALLARIVDVRKMLHGLLKRVKATRN